MTTDNPLPSAIPAATLIILREANGAPPDILMVERAQTMAFAAGALVFPGGRIDAADRALAATLGGDIDDMAARVAAIRETIEEVGLAIGVHPMPGVARLVALRHSLHQGRCLGDALADARLALDPAALTAFARWRPAHRDRRIYDTRFYLARLPAGSPTATIDATENSRLFWASAAATLAMVDAGAANVIFPTRRNLDRLARFATLDEIFADANRHPIVTVTPWIERRDGADHLCIPDGIGYPITAEPLANAMRG